MVGFNSIHSDSTQDRAHTSPDSTNIRRKASLTKPHEESGESEGKSKGLGSVELGLAVPFEERDEAKKGLVMDLGG